jgi:beta-lactamase superfamily II metal-dependent hydrolase
LYARVSRVDSLSTSPHHRASFEFDCIDADYVDGVGVELPARFRADEIKPFALLRVVTTPARFRVFAGVVPVPGNWFHLEIEPSGAGLPTWHAPLAANGYSTHARGVTTYARRLESPDETPRRSRPRPQTLGAAVAPRVMLPSSLVAACAALPQPAARSSISTILRKVPRARSVLVRDVGQANFTSLRDDQGRAILHYDVGFPISFNRHTFPSTFNIDASETPPIILSHWDWDHLHAALHLPHLLDCPWIVPDQGLGPGAARLARILTGKGNLLVLPTSARIRFTFGGLVQSQGLAGDLNDTGLTVLVALASGRSVLLTGDADYMYLMHPKARTVDHLVATHHGARFDASVASVPTPRNDDCKLVISYGTRNVYRHPHTEALRKHFSAGWKSRITTAGRKGVAGRGDRVMS